MHGKSEGITYKTNWGSDNSRDAFSMELIRIEGDGHEVFIAEVVWWDETNRFTFEELKEPVPVSVLNALLSEAREKIKPQNIECESNQFHAPTT